MVEFYECTLKRVTTIKVLVVDGMVKCLVMKRFFVCHGDWVQSLQEVNQEVMRLCAVGEGSQMGSTGRVFLVIKSR